MACVTYAHLDDILASQYQSQCLISSDKHLMPLLRSTKCGRKKPLLITQFSFTDGACSGYFNVCPVRLCQHRINWDHVGQFSHHAASPEERSDQNGRRGHVGRDHRLLYHRLLCRQVMRQAILVNSSTSCFYVRHSPFRPVLRTKHLRG